MTDIVPIPDFPAGYPSATLRIEKVGTVDHDYIAKLTEFVAKEETTDVIIITHGYNTHKEAACRMYKEFFDQMASTADKADVKDAKFAVIGTLWDSLFHLGKPSSIQMDVKRVLEFLFKWEEIKGRTNVVASGVVALITALRAKNSSIKIHLIGHSLGARVANCTIGQWADTADKGPDDRLTSAFMIQAAFSANAWAAEVTTSGGTQPGYYHRVIEAPSRIVGPIVVTWSDHDYVLHVAYRLASIIFGHTGTGPLAALQDDSPYERILTKYPDIARRVLDELSKSADEQNIRLDDDERDQISELVQEFMNAAGPSLVYKEGYKAAGHEGVRCDDQQDIQQINNVGDDYGFEAEQDQRPRVYNIRASARIGGHGDFKHPEVAYAAWCAIKAGRQVSTS